MVTITKFFNANPELMSKLLLGQTVDIGDKLSIMLDQPADYLYFSFFLDGKYIGGLDHEFGGYITSDYGSDNTDTEHNMALQTTVTDCMVQLFPNCI